MFFWFLFFLYMGLMARLAGSGFGQKWDKSWVPEVLFVLPFGLMSGWAFDALGAPFMVAQSATALGMVISYGGMQSGTWMFLQWEGHEDPETGRTSTLKPIVDWIANKRGTKLGSEEYSWIAASLKGFIIGGPLLAVFWPIGYEVGSHAKGRTNRYFDPHIVSEVASGLGGWLTIYITVQVIKFFTGG